MKKLIPLFIACIFLSSCYKKWDCVCTITSQTGSGAPDVQRVYSELPGFKKAATKACNDMDDDSYISYGVTTDCKIID